MEKLRKLAGMVIVLSLLVLPVTLYGQEADPVEVCYGPSYEAFLAGEQAFDPSLWAADAVQSSIMGDMITTYSGHEEIAAHFEEMLASGIAMEISVQSVEGGTVTVESKVWDNDLRALGVAPLVGTEVCVVEDGKIQSLTWTISDESMADLGAALAALPQTGGEPEPVTFWLILLGGIILAAGLGTGYLHRRGRPLH